MNSITIGVRCAVMAMVVCSGEDGLQLSLLIVSREGVVWKKIHCRMITMVLTVAMVLIIYCVAIDDDGRGCADVNGLDVIREDGSGCSRQILRSMYQVYVHTQNFVPRR